MAAISVQNRIRGALWGMLIGDALSMPVHWIYQPDALKREYGLVKDYLAPKRTHPSSIMSLHSADRAGRKSARDSQTPQKIVGEIILKGKRHLWEVPNLHYHFGLQAGDNTLNLLVARVLMRTINENGKYDSDQFLKNYVEFMTTENSHNDTYAESYHRDFFANMARNVPLNECAGDEGHDTASMGGFVLLPPVILLQHRDKDAARASAIQQMTLTHKSQKLAKHASVFSDLLVDLLNGKDLLESVYHSASLLGLDIKKLVERVDAAGAPDLAVIGRIFSSACYIDDSFPALLYLAARYHDRPEDALIANTNCGGENCHKGAMLGAVLGAALGVDAFPQRWIDGLRDREQISQEIDRFVEVLFPVNSAE